MVCVPLRPRAASPDAIFFDFDGVIFNSEPVHLRATQEALRSRGLGLDPADYYTRYVGLDDATMFSKLGADSGSSWCSDDVHELIVSKALRFEALEAAGAALVPGAAECIRRMAEIAPLAVVSGARREEIERMLRRAALDGHFRTIVAAGETAFGKPAPDPYAAAAAKLNASSSRCIVIEDTAAGLAAAKAAGMPCIGVTTTFPRGKLALADAVVESLDEITADLVRSLVFA